MFQTKNTGKKISQLRKEKNITQMELADLMGVSYQAVSNWERGNSMPDISKLPELTEILGVSIDDLLTDGKPLELVRNVINGTENEYIVEENISIDTVVEIAPILKPSQTEKIIDKVVDNNKGKITIEEIAGIASSIDEDFLYKLIKQVNEKFTLDELCELAPYLDESYLYKLALEAIEFSGYDGLEKIAAYMDEDDLSEIVKKIDNTRVIVNLAPYMDDDAIGELAIKAAKADNIDLVNKLAPYVDQDDLHDIGEILVKKHGISGIKGIAAFL